MQIIVSPYLNSKFRNSKWRIQDGGRKCEKMIDLNVNQRFGVSGIVDDESELQIPKFKMVDPRWRTNMQKVD